MNNSLKQLCATLRQIQIFYHHEPYTSNMIVLKNIPYYNRELHNIYDYCYNFTYLFSSILRVFLFDTFHNMIYMQIEKDNMNNVIWSSLDEQVKP